MTTDHNHAMEGAAHEVSGGGSMCEQNPAYFVRGSINALAHNASRGDSGVMAYFLTFTTYGTWLHGSDKGVGSVDRNHNTYGSPFLAVDPVRQSDARARMVQPPYVLNEMARCVVRDAIVAICAKKRWNLLALHVRSNHVHVVVSAQREPGRLMSDLKARASHALNRLGADDQTVRWTRHGSTRHLFDEASVIAAVQYTLDEQGSPLAVYDPRKGKEPGTK